MLIIDPWPSRTYDNKFVFLWMIEDNRVKELPVSCEIDTSATYLYMYIHEFQQSKNNRTTDVAVKPRANIEQIVPEREAEGEHNWLY